MMELPIHTLTLWLGLLLALKHFVADGPLQTAYMYLNKGKFMHPGGLLHAAIHGVGTALALYGAGILFHQIDHSLFAVLILADTLIHYMVDWGKVNLTKKYGWSGRGKTAEGVPCLQIYSNMFFIALVADQCLHFATYAVILAAVAAL